MSKEMRRDLAEAGSVDGRRDGGVINSPPFQRKEREDRQAKAFGVMPASCVAGYKSLGRANTRVAMAH